MSKREAETLLKNATSIATVPAKDAQSVLAAKKDAISLVLKTDAHHTTDNIRTLRPLKGRGEVPRRSPESAERAIPVAAPPTTLNEEEWTREQHW